MLPKIAFRSFSFFICIITNILPLIQMELSLIDNDLIFNKAKENDWKQIEYDLYEESFEKRNMSNAFEEGAWTQFINEMYGNLSEYDTFIKYSKALITRTELDLFIKSQNNYDNVKALLDRPARYHEIVKLVENPVKSDVKIVCSSEGKLIVEGNFVEMHKVINECEYEIDKIRIFALNTVFIEMDFTVKKELVIIAPTWNIINTTKTTNITLNPQMEPYFFGLADRIINAEMLHINGK